MSRILKSSDRQRPPAGTPLANAGGGLRPVVWYLFALHVFALCGFVLAQPVYNWVALQPEFLVAHRFDLQRWVFMVGSLSVLVPLALFCGVMVFRVFGRSPLAVMQSLLVGALVGVFALQFMSAVAPGVAFALSGLVLLTAALAYNRLAFVRSVLSVAALGAVAFPLLFLLGDPVRGMVLGQGSASIQVAGEGERPDADVVVVVLDELPLAALLSSEREIDAERFPNFARMAATSTWYPRATAPHTGTTRALPALMTGNLPHPERRLARWEDHPDNIFFWAAAHYGGAVFGVEPMTELCPESICPRTDLGRRVMLPMLGLDVAVLYGHTVLPERLAREQLPDIDNQWHNFLNIGPAAPDARERFRGSIGVDRATIWRERMQDLGRGFNFFHALLPHDPYIYLPDGSRYSMRTHGLTDALWQTPPLNQFEYQRFMVQLQYTDVLLGELIDHLKDIGHWDSALVIVTSDHGKSFRVGTDRRVISSGSLEDTLGVPLFIKRPGQDEAGVDEYLASVIDIVPTIVDVVGRPLEVEVDGTSLVAAERPARDHVSVSCMSMVCDEEMEARADELEQIQLRAGEVFADNALGWKRDNIHWSPELDFFVPALEHVGVLGRSPSDFALTSEPDIEVVLDDEALFADVDLDSQLPAVMRGRLHGLEETLDAGLAVALNGRIAGLTRPVRWDGSDNYFAVLLPPQVFEDGRNEVAVYRVEREAGVLVLAQLGVLGHVDAAISEIDSDEASVREAVVLDTGEIYPIDSRAFRGAIGHVSIVGNLVRIPGWAVNTEHMQPVKRVIAFSDGQAVASAVPDVHREGVATLLGSDTVNPSGFEMAVSRRILAALGEPLEFYALYEDGEHRYAGHITYAGWPRCMLEKLPADPAVCDK